MDTDYWGSMVYIYPWSSNHKHVYHSWGQLWIVVVTYKNLIYGGIQYFFVFIAESSFNKILKYD